MWLFGDAIENEKNKMIAEAKEIRIVASKILEEAKTLSQKEYIKFDIVPSGTEAFLYGMKPLFKNRFVLSWFLSHTELCKKNIVMNMSQNNNDKVINDVAQMTMIDSLLLDLERFEAQYNVIAIENKKNKNK